jgi:hypothetical protein
VDVEMLAARLVQRYLNIIPVGIGNMAGGAFLVALPFWYALGPARRHALAASGLDGLAASGAGNRSQR